MNVSERRSPARSDRFQPLKETPDSSVIVCKQEVQVDTPVLSQLAYERQLKQRRVVAASFGVEAELDWCRDVLRLSDRCQSRQYSLTHGASHALPLSLFELKTDAVKLVLKFAESGSARAIYMKGIMLEFGLSGLTPSRADGLALYERSAQDGCHRAHYRIGQHAERLGDIKRACTHYERGAAGDDVACLYRLSLMMLHGQHGYEIDHDKGVACAHLSALGADADAPQGAYFYALLLAGETSLSIDPQLLKQDTAESVRFFEKAAMLGHAPSQLRLGKAHEFNELGCPFSPSLSLHFYTLAAGGNEAEADMAVAKWYLAGSDDGVIQRDEQKSFFHADIAARRGLGSAEFAMGYFYEVGIACDADVEKARMYYDRAAAHGSEEARARIVGISRSGTLSRKDHEYNVSTKIHARHATIKLNSTQAGRYRARASSNAVIREKSAPGSDLNVESLDIAAAPATFTTPSPSLKEADRTPTQGHHRIRSWAPSSPQWSEMERERPYKPAPLKHQVLQDYHTHSRVQSWTQESARERCASPNIAPSELSSIQEGPLSTSPRPESSVSNIPPFRLPTEGTTSKPQSTVSAGSKTSSAIKRGGPATFEEMGIPIANKKKEDCCVM